MTKKFTPTHVNLELDQNIDEFDQKYLNKKKNITTTNIRD